MYITKLAEKYISTPYKKYSVAVTCNILRRLTIMEWTILHIVGEFSNYPKYQNKTLAFFMEDVLSINNSEALVRPCIESLVKNKYVDISNYSVFLETSDLPLTSIHLTQLGLDILKRGYIPGSTKVVSETVYYDMLQGRTYDHKPTDFGSQPNTTPVTAQTSFDMEFPSDSIIAGINNGLLFRDKYRETNAEAVEVICNSDVNDWRTDKLILSIDEQGNLSYNLPAIPSVTSLVAKMIASPVNGNTISRVLDISDGLPAVYSVGSNIPWQIESWLKSVDTVFVSKNEYVWLTQQHVNISCPTIFILGTQEFSIDVVDGKRVVYLPLAFTAPSTFLAFDNGLCLNWGCIEPSSGFTRSSIAIAYRTEDKIDFTQMLKDGLTHELKDIPRSELLCLFPIFKTEDGLFETVCKQHLATLDNLSDKIEYVDSLGRRHEEIFKVPLDSDLAIRVLADVCPKDDIQDYYDAIQSCYNGCLNKYSHETYEAFVLQCIKDYAAKSISDLEYLLSVVGACDTVDYKSYVTSANTSLTETFTPDMLDTLYLQAVRGEGKPFPMPMLACSEIYNKFVVSLSQLQRVCSGYSFHDKLLSEVTIQRIILENDTIEPLVQDISNSIVAASKSGTTVFENGAAGHILYQNITRLLSLMTGDFSNVNFYLVDTCAFLHTPDILSLFEPTNVVRIPFTVLRELDYHKDHQEDMPIRKSAAYACKCIERALNHSSNPGHVSVGVEPRDYPELLPGGFSKTKHDDLILSAAFFYSKANPIILTDDTNFRNIARSQGFSTKPWKEFVEEHNHSAVRTTDSPSSTAATKPVEVSKAEQCEPPKKESSINSYLSQSINALTLTPFNLPKKKVKALATAGYDTLQSLYDANTGEINKKFKSVSMRDLALRTATKLKSEADKLK